MLGWVVLHSIVWVMECGGNSPGWLKYSAHGSLHELQGLGTLLGWCQSGWTWGIGSQSVVCLAVLKEA
jgi:hypothetical protein